MRPMRNPRAVVSPMPSRTPSQGFQPRLRPLLSPVVTAFPMMKPHAPYMSTCASEIMPPKAERKTMLAAATPSSSDCVSTTSTK